MENVSLKKSLECEHEDCNTEIGISPESNSTDILPIIKLAITNSPESVAKLIRTWLYSDKTSDEDNKMTEYTCRQKAAIFLIAIGLENASEIFKFLSEEEVETLTFELARIEIADYNEKDAILHEFYELMTANQFVSTGGIDYAREILETTFGSQKAIDVINRLTSSLQVRPFDFIRRVDPAHFLNFIQQEHPQVIALILSYLEPNKAAIILQNLPDKLQSEVAGRIACLDRVNVEIVREIERVLEMMLTSSGEDYIASGGVENVVEIINLVDRASEKQIIEALEDEDPELAEEIKKRMFVFEDIVMLDDRSIQKVMREVDSQELAKALKSVDPVVQDKIFRNLSKSAAAMIKEDMEYMGPIRLKDVEESQQRFVSVIRRLEDNGEILIARAGEDELVLGPVYEEKKDEEEKKIERKLLFEQNQNILNHNNKRVLNKIDDETIALATYGMDKKTRCNVLSYLTVSRRFKVKRLLKNLKQVWMDSVRNAQDEIITRINNLDFDSSDSDSSYEPGE
jgi:flagellar motor switch protein FliG